MADRKKVSSELERLQAAGIDLLRKHRPRKPPLLFFLAPLVNWFEERHIELIRKSSFMEARRAFNPVFIHLPADGCRLTELAARANMTKQAMAELVEELVDLGYLERFPDPKDRRAKIIVRAEKGLEAHKATMRAFAQIDRELEALIGRNKLEELRAGLAETAETISNRESAR